MLNIKEKMTECTIKCPRQGVCKRVALQYIRDGGQRTQIMTTRVQSRSSRVPTGSSYLSQVVQKHQAKAKS